MRRLRDIVYGVSNPHDAAARNRVSKMKKYVQRGGDVTIRNTLGDTPLHEACTYIGDSGDTTKEQKRKGCIKIRTRLRKKLGNQGRMKNGPLEMMELHVRAGSNVDAQNIAGDAPLHKAALNGRVLATGYLVRAGADLNVRNEFNQTPLHLACIFGNMKLVKMLVQGGADTGAQDTAGETPYHKACRHKHHEIVLYLHHQVQNANPNEYPRLWRRPDASGENVIRAVGRATSPSPVIRGVTDSGVSVWGGGAGGLRGVTNMNGSMWRLAGGATYAANRARSELEVHGGEGFSNPMAAMRASSEKIMLETSAAGGETARGGAPLNPLAGLRSATNMNGPMWRLAGGATYAESRAQAGLEAYEGDGFSNPLAAMRASSKKHTLETGAAQDGAARGGASLNPLAGLRGAATMNGVGIANPLARGGSSRLGIAGTVNLSLDGIGAGAAYRFERRAPSAAIAATTEATTGGDDREEQDKRARPTTMMGGRSRLDSVRRTTVRLVWLLASFLLAYFYVFLAPS